MAVPSEAGRGSQYGHLGAVMPAAQYQALHGAVAYVAPANPGIQAPTAANATAIQISQANCQHDKALEQFTKHHDTCAKLKCLILAAVEDCYISALQEEVLGYAQVSVDALLMHLNMMYSTINQEVLEVNHNNISPEWNPDDGIETIFTRITQACRFAAAAGAEHVIQESTTIYPALTAINNTGVFIGPCANWRKCPVAEQTLMNFTSDFMHAWKERGCLISAKSAGYQALLVTHADNKKNDKPANLSSNKDKLDVLLVDSVKMYYCWSHGLGFNPIHNSQTGNSKKAGHCDDATIKHRKGRSNSIWESNCNRS